MIFKKGDRVIVRSEHSTINGRIGEVDKRERVTQGNLFHIRFIDESLPPTTWAWDENLTLYTQPLEPDPADPVDHPAHYGGDTTYEAIKVIDAWGLGFALGNVIKYVSRAGKKDPVTRRQDLEKAYWYLGHELWKDQP